MLLECIQGRPTLNAKLSRDITRGAKRLYLPYVERSLEGLLLYRASWNIEV